MDRRSFFTLVGGLGLAPVVGCIGRDGLGSPPDAFAAELEKFRTFIVPDGIEPALDFRPLRQPAPSATRPAPSEARPAASEARPAPSEARPAPSEARPE